MLYRVQTNSFGKEKRQTRRVRHLWEIEDKKHCETRKRVNERRIAQKNLLRLREKK